VHNLTVNDATVKPVNVYLTENNEKYGLISADSNTTAGGPGGQYPAPGEPPPEPAGGRWAVTKDLANERVFW
jgi:hypothetical protein